MQASLTVSSALLLTVEPPPEYQSMPDVSSLRPASFTPASAVASCCSIKLHLCLTGTGSCLGAGGCGSVISAVALGIKGAVANNAFYWMVYGGIGGMGVGACCLAAALKWRTR